MAIADMNDSELWQSFVQEGSQSAFRALVERHLPLVLGTARRGTRDNALAEDVAQTVFILLAKKAPHLPAGTVLPGWLYRTTRFVASRAVTSEQRRRLREEQAITMQEQNASDDAQWEKVSPELDRAMEALNETERNALLLRFINEQSMREVGSALGLTEEAAKKRVARALEKLRSLLKRRGVEITAVALAVGLSQRMAEAAPVSLATGISNQALPIAAGAGAVGASALLLNVLAAWRWAKIKVILFGSAALVLLWLSVPPMARQWQEAGLVSAGDSMGKIKANSLSDKRSKETSAMAAKKSAKATSDDGKWRWLSITALDAQTRQPIAGVEVRHPDLIVSPTIETLYTDSNGVVKIKYPADSPAKERIQQFAVWMLPKDYAQRQIQWLSTTGNVYSIVSEQYVVQLERGIALSGTVVDEAGQPLSGIRLGLHGSNYRGFRIERSNGVVTTPPEIRAEDFAAVSILGEGTNSNAVMTDSGGHFKVEHFPSDLRSLEIILKATDGNKVKFRTMQAEPSIEFPATEIRLEDLKSGTARLVLSHGFSVDGVVVNDEDKPVAGATVLEATQWGNLKIASKNTTDAAGHFHLENRPAREFIFSASAEGWGSASTVVAVHAGMESVKIQLPPELPLRGQVVNESGQPQKRVKVSAVDYLNEGLGFVWAGETDNEGRFIWREAPTNELALAFITQSGSRIFHLQATTNEHLIVLGGAKSEVEVIGKVIDENSGAPIENFSVGISHTVTGDSPDGPERVVPGTSGEFVLKIPFSEFHAGQRPVWTLWIKAEGYQQCLSHSFNFDEGDQHLEIALEKETMLQGQVTIGPNGEPAGHAQIGFSFKNDSLFSSKPGELYSSHTPLIRSDQEGKFNVPKPLGAEAMVVFHEAGWAILPLSLKPKNMEIQLKPWGQIEGTVLLGNKPAAHETVTVEKLVADLADPLMIHEQTTTDEDGHFVLKMMPVGEFVLSLESDEWKTANGAYAGTLQTPAMVQAGETTTVVMQSAGSTVSMRLHGPAGDWTNAVALLSRDIQIPAQPPRDHYVSDKSHRAARLAFSHDPAVINAYRNMRTYGGHLTKDGDVTFENIPAGTYVLEVTLFRKLEHGPGRAGDRYPEAIAKLRATISVPAPADQSGEAPAVFAGDFTLEPL